MVGVRDATIRHCPRYVVLRDGNVHNIKTGKVMKPYVNKNGYLRITLMNDGGGRSNYFIHRLVAQSFIPNPEGKLYVDHIDRDPSNNSVDNLRWATFIENNKNRYTPKTRRHYCECKCGNSVYKVLA